MVTGVFTARWTVPTLLKGTRQVFADLAEHKHLIPIAIVAGMLWAVANTLTVFAIRDVGLAIAFPLWNTNSLVGIFWGRVLFGELKGASAKNIAKVLLGTLAIVSAAVMLGFSTIHGDSTHASHAAGGVLAAAGASLLWGTMYIPYRKAYISGMNPLSFVTVFTIGELGAVFALALALDRTSTLTLFSSPLVRPMLFWLFLGGFVWVIGDIFQQYATKFLGIGRGIPLSNTNQLWGLAWGALVFSELANADASHRLLVVAGSIVMILGALAVSTAVATEREHTSTNEALARECDRYTLDYDRVLRSYSGEAGAQKVHRSWWDYAILACAFGVFVVLGVQARRPQLEINTTWTVILAILMFATATICAWRLWKVTRFA
jgi:glucose uptake protein GlcU